MFSAKPNSPIGRIKKNGWLNLKWIEMKGGYKILLIIFLAIIALKMPQQYPAGNAVYFRLILFCFIMAEIAMLFKEITGFKKIRESVKNFFTVIVSCVIIFILLESVFMFVPRSHGVGYTLGSELWFSKYWKPINSLGYRDNEPEPGKDSLILFVGDSFTEGHGLKNVNDRFSDIVREELKKGAIRFSIANIGKNGLDSRGEFDTMMYFINKTKKTPGKIVLQYFGNDIEKAAMSGGKDFKGFTPYENLSSVMTPFIKGSYLINYFYWTFPQQDVKPYIEFLTSSYNDTAIFSRHENDLNLFVDYANRNSAELIVIVFPFMKDTEMSKDLPLQDRVVNNNDGHASKKVNRMIANEILKNILN
jgi:lysophospholipase L1-like esterase